MLKLQSKVWPLVLAMFGAVASLTMGCMQEVALDDTDFGDARLDDEAGCEESLFSRCMGVETGIITDRPDNIECATCSGTVNVNDGTVHIQVSRNGGYWEDRPQRIRLMVRTASDAVLADYQNIAVTWPSADESIDSGDVASGSGPDGVGRWRTGELDAIWYSDGESTDAIRAKVEFDSDGQTYEFAVNLSAGN